jgi:formylglycine-generating enzyme required for sulfatase activity
MKLMANAEDRKGYRLPTEAEWEYSCRAGASTGYSFGEPWVLLEKYGWLRENSPDNAQPAGSLKPNDLGLFNLHGNLDEWCQDSVNVSKPGNKEISNSVILYKSISRVFRGGSYFGSAASLRADRRNWDIPTGRLWYIGFRLARIYH